MLILSPTGGYSLTQRRALLKTFLDPDLELEDVDYADVK